jgi:hypothetical protein
MTLPENNKPLPGTGQPGEGQPPAAPAPQEAPITRQEFEAFQSQIKSALENNYRGVQKITTGFQNRVQQRLEQFQRDLATSGIQLSPAQLQNARTQIAIDTLSAGEENQPVPGGAANDEGEDLSPEEKAIWEALTYTQKKYGVQIEDDDPEAKMINVRGSIEELYASHEKALETKKARIGGTAPTNPPETSTVGAGNPALSSGGVGSASNDLSNINDDDMLWKMANKP